MKLKRLRIKNVISEFDYSIFLSKPFVITLAFIGFVAFSFLGFLKTGIQSPFVSNMSKTITILFLVALLIYSVFDLFKSLFITAGAKGLNELVIKETSAADHSYLIEDQQEL